VAGRVVERPAQMLPHGGGQRGIVVKIHLFGKQRKIAVSLM
jgi:hypothetical protein